MKTIAYHFTRGMKLRDGTPLEVGRTYTHVGAIKLCLTGYHGSERILDALRYAPGFQLSRTSHGGEILRDTDKLVSSERTALWTLDARAVVLRAARMYALEVCHLWKYPRRAEVVRWLLSGDPANAADAAYAADAATYATYATDAATYAAYAYAVAHATYATYAAYDAADAAHYAAYATYATYAVAHEEHRERQEDRMVAWVEEARSGVERPREISPDEIECAEARACSVVSWTS